MKIQPNNRPNTINRPNNSNQGQVNQGQNNTANSKPNNNQGTPNSKAAGNANSNINSQGGNLKREGNNSNQTPNKSISGNNQGGNKGNNKGNMAGQSGNKSNSHLSGNKNSKNSHNSSNNNNSSNLNSNYKPNLIMGAPTYELPVKEQTFESEKKFTGRCRLFVANLPSSVTEDSLKSLFEQYGQVSEVFLGKQNSFAFVKMDTRKHAEEARSSLDNKIYEGKTLRVRLAAHAAAVRVKNLSHMVTNELLEYSFSYFGEVERAIVITDDRGRSIGEGIVEFARKSSAQNCIKKCTNECFLLTSHPAPVFIESFEQRDEDEGFSEKHINKNSSEFRIERELGPRFADPGTFEFEFACRFKQLYEIEKERRSRLENEIQEARHALLNQLELQRTEHQTKLLKEKLREMEEKVAHFDELRNRTLEQEKMREQERVQQEMMLRQREEEILRRGQIQDYALLRRQENDLRQQANVLQDMLERQEVALRSMNEPPPQQQPPQQMYQPPPQVHHQPMGHPDQGYQHPPPMMDAPYGDPYGYNGLNANGAPMDIVGNRYGHPPPPVPPQSGGYPPPPPPPPPNEYSQVGGPSYGGPHRGHGGQGGGPSRGGDGGPSQHYHRPSPYGSNKGRKKF